MKKRGFGEGKWNGFGGKLDRDVDYKNGDAIADRDYGAIVRCARRELHEESGIYIEDLAAFRHAATMHYMYDSKPDTTMVVFVFEVSLSGSEQEASSGTTAPFDYSSKSGDVEALIAEARSETEAFIEKSTGRLEKGEYIGDGKC